MKAKELIYQNVVAKHQEYKRGSFASIKFENSLKSGASCDVMVSKLDLQAIF